MAGQLTTNFDYSKIFIWGNRYKKATFTNGTGSPVTLNAGQLLGRVAATNKVAVQVSTATDGSQVPIGVLRDTHTVAASASVDVFYCVSGDVAREKLLLGGADTLATVVELAEDVPLGTIEDVLISSGIIPVTGTENTIQDNQ